MSHKNDSHVWIHFVNLPDEHFDQPLWRYSGAGTILTNRWRNGGCLKTAADVLSGEYLREYSTITS